MNDVDLEEGADVPTFSYPGPPGDDSDNGDDHHDQLPNVEEYKAQAGVVVGPKNNMRWGSAKCCLIVCVPLVLAAICAGIALFAIEDKATVDYITGGSPTGIPSDGVGDTPDTPDALGPVASTRVFDVADFVVEMGWSSRQSTESPGTPQWEAVEWIADYDLRMLPIDDSLAFKQRYVMSVLYFALDGASWKYKLDFLSREDVCDWFKVWPNEQTPGEPVGVQVGVSCDNNKAVSNMFIPANNLRGDIPQELGLLTEMESLSLYGNKISGSIPMSMKRLTGLRQLILHDNELQGLLPDMFGDMSLTYLNLANNNITGELPQTLFDMTGLVTLNLAKNNVEADIADFALLQNIQNVFLEQNVIYGQIGDWILTLWPKIEVLDLSDNILAGPLPSAIFRHPTLVICDLHANFFTGALSITGESVASQITFLSLQENLLAGPIPDNIGLMTKLEHLDLGSNEFTSAIPDTIFGLTNLVLLFLAYNDFAPGAIPASIDNLESLVDLSLKETNRNGVIPASIGNLANLVLLDLNRNSLSGDIPSTIGNLNNLSFLFLNENQLVGEVPASFSNLQKLRTLLLNANSLTGSTTSVCAPSLPQLNIFIGDCIDPSLVGTPGFVQDDELDCPCCTKCCSDNNANCKNEEWYGELDPVWEYKYARKAYSFNEASVVFPSDVFGVLPDDGDEDLPGDAVDYIPDYIVVPDLSEFYSIPDEGNGPDGLSDNDPGPPELDGVDVVYADSP
jgi:Leucine-rich repeat (LRR) protein